MRTESRGLIPAVAALLVVGLCGCASIVSGRSASVKLDSHPRAANVSIRDPKGAVVATTRTPDVVSLPRGRTWFRPAKYTATFSKPGYRPARVELGSKVNPWVAGNLVLGGPVGLVVDSATGAGWQPKHAEIAQSLTPMGDFPVEEEIVEGDMQLTAAEEPTDGDKGVVVETAQEDDETVTR